MKTQINALVLVAALLLAGCQSTPKQTAYETLSAVKRGVELAVDTAAVLHFNNKMPTTKWHEVKHLYEVDFIPNFRMSVDLAMLDYEQPAPALIADIATRILTIVSQYQTKE